MVQFTSIAKITVPINEITESDVSLFDEKKGNRIENELPTNVWERESEKWGKWTGCNYLLEIESCCLVPHQ